MKHLIITLLLTGYSIISFGYFNDNQTASTDHNSIQSIQDMPRYYIRGIIRNQEDEILPGASVVFLGTNKGVHANEDGEYFLTGILSGRHSIEVSCLGYETKIIDYTVHEGQNFINFTLDREAVELDPVIVTAQKREQQLLNIPSAISHVSKNIIENLDINEVDELSDYVPGLNIRIQNTLRPSFVIRGLTSDEVSASAQPRVSVYYNDIPINRVSGAAIEIFDMERIEVLKGPQGSLFGRGAQIGAVHFVTQKPTNELTGSFSAGIGDYGQKNLTGIINTPVIEDKLMVRFAGKYDYVDGYIKNIFGGNLNGKNTMAGRASIRFLPFMFTKIDLEVHYQKNDAPGTGFISGTYPNTNGSTNFFDYEASLEQGENLKTQKEIYGVILNARHYLNEHTYITSISSMRNHTAYAKWDGDGSAAGAIIMSEDVDAKQITQELRLNYSLGSKLNGFVGASYWREKATQEYGFMPNEQHMVHLFFDPSGMITEDGQPFTVPALPPYPELGPLGGMPLATDHEEENISEAVNRSIEAFADGTYRLTNAISLTAGIRYIKEKFTLSNEAKQTDGSPSTLGMFTGNYPNLFFRPSEKQEIEESYSSITGRATISYKYNANTTFYAGYAKGRRPNVLQFTSNGTPETLSAEIINSYDAGFKGLFFGRLYFSTDLFYHQYKDFQTSVWVADPESGNFNYLTVGIEKAKAYGAETSLNYTVIEQLKFFGNYAFIHSKLSSDSNDDYSNNSFRLTPKHSFTIGAEVSYNISRFTELFVIPTYSYKSHFYFEDANTEGIEQEAYGLINIRGGIRFKNPELTLSAYATNLLNEEYLISGGNTGSLFGIPTFIPGAPRMIGTKVLWNF